MQKSHTIKVVEPLLPIVILTMSDVSLSHNGNLAKLVLAASIIGQLRS